MKTDAQRAATMRAVKSSDTAPEMIVRRALHGAGYRYRLHRSDLPGKPDIVMPRHQVVIFVHGCFWHGHHCKRGARVPKTNTDYWLKKVKRNIERDGKNRERLRDDGWTVITIWECEAKEANKILGKVSKALNFS